MRDPVELEKSLGEHAFRMDFFHVLRLIENAYPEYPRIGESLRARDDVVKFGQDPELIFQPSMLGKFKAASAEKQARLAVNFFGLMGPNGPMPIHFTEYVRDRLRNAGDGTLARFLDIFHHRMIALFYRARAMTEPTMSLDRAHADRFSYYVGSLFGMGMASVRNRDEIPDFAKLHFAGLLASQRRPALGLVAILTEFFKLPVHIEQFVGTWLRLPPEAQTRLGAWSESNQLGMSTVLGRRVWDVQNKFRIVIGPLGYADYVRFFPDGDSMQRLIDWVRNYVGDVLDWDVQLRLKKNEIPSLKLGGSMRLGWNTWLINRIPIRDADQLLIKPMIDHFH